MEICVNGKTLSLDASVSLDALLERLGLPAASVVIEHNGDIIPAGRLARVFLRDGDTVEIVRLVGGG